MIHKLVRYLRKNELQTETDDAFKLIFLALTNFFIIGSYSILRSLKTSIFLGLVGKEYAPHTRIVSIILLVPTMLLFAKLVDRLKRYQLVYLFLGIYGVLSLVFAYFLNHPAYGLHNTLTSPWRSLGWFFEIFMDLYQPLIVGTYWSFVNSVSTPSFASDNYGFIVSAARIGGILTPFLSLLLLEKSTLASWNSIPLLIVVASLLLLGAACCIYSLTKKVSSDHLHGYEAAFQTDKASDKKASKPTVWEGLKLMLTQPYVLGIFAMVYGFEIINVIFDYQMQVLMSIEHNNEVMAMSSFMLIYTGTFQALSFFFAFFGTSTLPKKIGVKNCLIVMPITVVILTLTLLAIPKLSTIFIIMVVMRAMNYGFNQPIREILYIPTVKDIQFKSKAWIDSFGRSFSKTSGSVVNIATFSSVPYIGLLIQSSFSIGVAAIWTIVAFMVGKKYQTTIERNEVIGKSSK